MTFRFWRVWPRGGDGGGRPNDQQALSFSFPYVNARTDSEREARSGD